MIFPRVLLLAFCFLCAFTEIYATPVRAADGLLDPELIELYRGSNVNPFDVPATNNYAMKLVRQGRYDRALKLLNRAQQLAPGRNDIAKNVAQLNLLMTQIEGLDLNTSLSYSESFKDNEIPFIPRPWGLDTSVENVNKPASDSFESQSLLNVNPFDSRSLAATASIKLERGDLRGALNDFQRAKQLSPWMSELDQQIAALEAQVSALGVEDLTDSRTSIRSEELDSPEPFDIWPVDQTLPPN